MRDFVTTLLPCLELRFPHLAFGDVVSIAIESHRPPSRAVRGCCFVFQPAHLAIGTKNAILKGHGALFDQLGKHLGDPRPVVRVNNVHEELRVCIKGAGRSAINLFGGWVKVQRLERIRGNGPYGGLDGPQDVCQFLFGCHARFRNCLVEASRACRSSRE